MFYYVHHAPTRKLPSVTEVQFEAPKRSCNCEAEERVRGIVGYKN